MTDQRCKLFIAIEGGDGAGKATQAELLRQAIGPDAEILHFPMYGTPGCLMVEEFLAGRLGDLKDLDPKTVSMFFTQDRLASFRDSWGKLYRDPSKIIIADRYTQSNVLYQGSRYAVVDGRLNADKLWDYISWLNKVEYQSLGLPSPDVTLWLDVMPSTSQKMLKDRPSKRTDGDKHDILEEDISGQDAAYLVGQYMTKVHRDFLRVDCVKGYKHPTIRTPDEIHERIMKVLNPYLDRTSLKAAP